MQQRDRVVIQQTGN